MGERRDDDRILMCFGSNCIAEVSSAAISSWPGVESLLICAAVWLLVSLVWLSTLSAAEDAISLRQKLQRLRIWLFFGTAEIAIAFISSPALATGFVAVLVFVASVEIGSASGEFAWALAGLTIPLALSYVCQDLLAGAAVLAAAVTLLLPYRATVVRVRLTAIMLGVFVGIAPFAIYAAQNKPGLLQALLLGVTTSHLIDIVSGFAGKRGTHKPFRRLSPNKTIRGFCAGFLAASVCSLLIYVALFREWSWWAPLAIGAVLWSVTAAGDLVGSKAKRIFGIKDFGTLFEPHGGVMDRLDSLAPVVVVCCALW